MYTRFAFEGDIHDTLDCVPMAVRRKLDLAQLKISLIGWQTLSRSERLALCHLPVDTEAERLIYVEVLQGFAAHAGIPLGELTAAKPAQWAAGSVPPSLQTKAETIGVALSFPRWSQLDEDARYALVKLADPRRDPAKLQAALIELGLAFGPRPTLPADGVVCGRS